MLQWSSTDDRRDGNISDLVFGRDIAAGSSNVDGTAVSLFRNSALSDLNLPFDCHYLAIAAGGWNAANANVQVLLDILVDPTGGTSWSVLIEDLLVGMTQVNGLCAPYNFYHFPIWIPAGSRLGARARTRHTANRTGNVIAYVCGEPTHPDAWWCGSGVESLGINAATSQGTDIPDTAAANAWSSWTNVGSPTSHRYGSVQLGINGSDATAVAASYLFQMGYNSTELRGVVPVHRHLTTNEVGFQIGQMMPNWCDIPAGTQMQVRQTASVAAAETLNCAIYGVY
jgi:hypothetical protein